jgi:protein-S-isoprenylcysteine O-methyltransferase Ste14
MSLAGSTASQFRRSGTTLEPFRPDQASVLVTSGANAISRNPMYLGLAGLLLANAVRTGSWVALVPLAGFVLVVDRLQVVPEEAALRAKFGADYDAYCRAAPRWLGRRSVRPSRT